MRFLTERNELLELLDLTEIDPEKCFDITPAADSAVLMTEMQVASHAYAFPVNMSFSGIYYDRLFFKGVPVIATHDRHLLENAKCKICGYSASSIRRVSNASFEMLCEYHTNLKRLRWELDKS